MALRPVAAALLVALAAALLGPFTHAAASDRSAPPMAVAAPSVH